MSPAEKIPKKRKACLTCIRAKAKCSPSEPGSDICHRCQRLDKLCVFEERVKKSGPKSRSRVRQLEQRVESLIDLISAKNATSSTTTTSSAAPPEDGATVLLPTPDSSGTPVGTSSNCVLEFPSRSKAGSSPFQAYDPVDGGIIEVQHAYRLLNMFKTSFISAFPFVVVKSDASVLRRQQPFLFHAILAVTSWETPSVQCLLEDEFRRQIARTIEHARRDFEILQGLLVYAAWYHSFYHPINQQLAMVVQLCVALVQELGLSRPEKKGLGLASVMRCGDPPTPTDNLAGKRAFLGTYYITVSFAQLWRNRTTLPHTHFMAQCCTSFTGSAVATDALITPLIQLCELSSRVNDHFSYGDIEDSEIKGELMLEMSTSGFRSDLMRIKDSCSTPSLAQNTTLNLMFNFLDAWIHECSLHSSRWQTASQSSPSPPSLTRLKMLQRTMDAATSFLTTLLHTPEATLYQLSFQVWSDCFYSVVLICKAVFLEDNERLGNTQFDVIPQEIDNLIPQNVEGGESAAPNANTSDHAKRPWDPLAVSREYDIQSLFARFLEKLWFTLPPDCVPWTLGREKRDSLHATACLSYTLIHGFKKRIQRFAAAAAANTHGAMSVHHRTGGGPDQFDASTTTAPPGFAYTAMPNAAHPLRAHSGEAISQLGFVNTMNIEALNLDPIALPASDALQQNGFDDLLWDSIMEDFTMAPF